MQWPALEWLWILRKSTHSSSDIHVGRCKNYSIFQVSTKTSTSQLWRHMYGHMYGLKFHAAFKTQTDQKLTSLLWLQLNWSQSSTHSDVLSDIRSLVSYLSWGFAWKFTRFACRRCACIQWNAHCMHRKTSIMQLEAFILQKKAKKKVSEFTTCKPAWKITSSRRPSGTSHTCAHFS